MKKLAILRSDGKLSANRALAAACVMTLVRGAMAGTLYESASPSDGSRNGYVVNGDFFSGIRFQLTSAMTADCLGANHLGLGDLSQPIFAALVQLTRASDLLLREIPPLVIEILPLVQLKCDGPPSTWRTDVRSIPRARS